MLCVQHWYCFSKTVAETKAWEYAKKTGLDVVTLCPTLVLGPMLQHTTNASSLALIKLLRGNLSLPVSFVEAFLLCSHIRTGTTHIDPTNTMFLVSYSYKQHCWSR